MVGLGEHAGSMVGRLSGGEKARVSLATALLGAPELLVLDEPTVGLDPLLRRDLWALFARLAGTGTALLVSSHVMDEAERCERLLLMRDGSIVADETPEGLLARTGCRDFESAFISLIEQGACRVRLRRTRATARRVLRQLRHDPRTVALLLAVPAVLMGLLAWILHDRPGDFDQFGPPLLGIFPLIVMFLVTSVATLRERTSGTLERLLTMPMAKADFVLGYALAFGLARRGPGRARLGTLRSASTGCTCRGRPGSWSSWPWSTRCLGTALGLSLSALASTEFQAVQFMPAFILPQLLLCGLIVPARPAPHRVALGLRRPAHVVRGRRHAAIEHLGRGHLRVRPRHRGRGALRRGCAGARGHDAAPAHAIEAPSAPPLVAARPWR